MIFTLAHENEMAQVAKELVNTLKHKNIILLKGDLASGKTTLVKYLLTELGVATPAVSPTFSLMIEYEHVPKIYHYDIYQNGSEKFISSNIWQNLLNDGYHFLEWADGRIEGLLRNLGMKFVVVKIRKAGEQRMVEIDE
jgi:tRNA threonylcarbamoyladenosine biosynthesis protein TsaE